MEKTAAAVILITLLTSSVAGQPQLTQQSTSKAKRNLLPGDFFYYVESFVEDIEVALAGAIGGPDLKSKALANNADEALAEAQKLAEQNKTEKAAKMIERYSEIFNRSQSIAAKSSNHKLSEELENLSRKNTETLKNVKEKVPEQARKPIEQAINRSNANREGLKEGKAGKRAKNMDKTAKAPNKTSNPAKKRLGPNKSLSRNLSSNTNFSESSRNKSKDNIEDGLKSSKTSKKEGNGTENSEGLKNNSGSKDSKSNEENRSENPLARVDKGLL